MKWENEVQRFYSLFILEYSFFMNEVFWVKFEVKKMKWENEVQRFHLLFILEYSFFYEWSVLGQIRSVIGVNKN
jgi:hypothetical protein